MVSGEKAGENLPPLTVRERSFEFESSFLSFSEEVVELSDELGAEEEGLDGVVEEVVDEGVDEVAGAFTVMETP